VARLRHQHRALVDPARHPHQPLGGPRHDPVVARGTAPRSRGRRARPRPPAGRGGRVSASSNRPRACSRSSDAASRGPARTPRARRPARAGGRRPAAGRYAASAPATAGAPRRAPQSAATVVTRARPDVVPVEDANPPAPPTRARPTRRASAVWSDDVRRKPAGRAAARRCRRGCRANADGTPSNRSSGASGSASGMAAVSRVGSARDERGPHSGETPDWAHSFGVVADAYERARPTYPREAAQWLVGQQAATVLELGCRHRQAHRAARRPRSRRSSPPTRPGHARPARSTSSPRSARSSRTAEELPVGDHGFDAVVAAQAFHWFDLDRALPEIARALKRGGRLGLVWNPRTRASPGYAGSARSSVPRTSSTNRPGL
jgi:hypothetical protein